MAQKIAGDSLTVHNVLLSWIIIYWLKIRKGINCLVSYSLLLLGRQGKWPGPGTMPNARSTTNVFNTRYCLR